MDTEDGQAFIKHLAYFVRTHEKALANALQLKRQPLKSHGSGAVVGAASPPSNSSSSSTFAAALSLPYLSFTSQNMKPAKLTLTPHHLFYLLSRFEDQGISVGPMNVRLENIHSDANPTNYVSFLSQAQRKKSGISDRDSMHSVTSMRSVVSGMTSLWSNLGLSGNSAAKTEKQKAAIKEDLRYLYSAFTKIPCLRLAPDHKARLIQGYEEFPFDTAVPLFAFKNLSALEIHDVDFRQFFGWDRLAEQLRSLTIKRGGVEDITDLLINIVLDDADKRRRRSAKTSSMPWPASSPSSRHADLSKSDSSVPSSPAIIAMMRTGSTGSKATARPRRRSQSPSRPGSSRHGSSHARNSTPNLRRSSGSSGSSSRSHTPRGSSSNLLSFGALPTSKWRFLRHLSLADNGLTTISASGLAPLANTLQSLDLSSNLFTEIPDSLATLTSLRALNLSNCMIESLHSLARNPLPAITTLNLRANRLISLAGVERLLSLERLDLRENRLADPIELARLTGIPYIQEIYVYKNPFVKTHSNYRVVIFNLFRTSPGYTEDVVIDSTGPGYSERKQLVERVPEAMGMPVIKPAPTQVVFQEPEYRQVESIVDTPVQRERETHQKDVSAKSDRHHGSHRRKKGAKRRIVELSQNNNDSVHSRTDSAMMPPPERPKPPPADSTYGSSPGATPVRKISEPSQAPEQLLPPLDTSFTSRSTLGHTESDFLPLLATESNVNGELYRKKIEALRSDFGNNWLSALGDESWEAHEATPNYQDRVASPALRPSAVSSRTPSQSIVSGGRTLG
ncbi:hypothetical protein K490DRAFT_41490 [Saccharata proteae CBS 121410]|uniref:L domain-like protein n=1 Tax=Saccharata proteae CBS 121410 TaxID=1314787 RepID=A0A9P4HY86_9PEZI|nr:hypothetical protein K490DRAFT_41490 [Saccharata proteae CBS 121410]